MYVLMYHYVRDLKNSRYNKIHALDVKKFKEQLTFLKRNYNIIKMEDLIEAIDCNKSISSKSLILTFDDGYIDHFNTVFPILDNLKIQGSFFIPAQIFCNNKLLDVNKIHFILALADINDIYNSLLKQLTIARKKGWDIPENISLIKQYAQASRFDDKETIFVKRILQTVLPLKLRESVLNNLFKNYVGVPENIFARELYLTKDQIKCMKNNGMFIGIHGYNHVWLGNLSKKEQENEISNALYHMSDFIDKSNWVMNYPYGSYNQITLDILAKLNCKLAFTTKVNNCNIDKSIIYELPRFDTNDFPPISKNFLNFEVLNEQQV